MKKYDIYLIWGKDCDGNILRYYGSTADLIKRKSNHKRNYNEWVKNGRPINTKCSSVHILDNGDWKMEKIDEIVGERWEAKKKEGEFIRNNDCINIQIASRTRKEYRVDNKGQIAQKQKQWKNANKNKISQKNKEWYDENKDEIKKKKKEYYDKNKQSISEKRKEKITCECGAMVSKQYLSQHRKTTKHIDFINSNNND